MNFANNDANEIFPLIFNEFYTFIQENKYDDLHKRYFLNVKKNN